MFNNNSISTSRKDYAEGLQAGKDEVISRLLELAHSYSPSSEIGQALKKITAQICEEFPAED